MAGGGVLLRPGPLYGGDPGKITVGVLVGLRPSTLRKQLARGGRPVVSARLGAEVLDLDRDPT
jgi:hypothetical protein